MSYLTLLSDIPHWVVKINIDNILLENIIKNVYRDLMVVNKKSGDYEECRINILTSLDGFQINYMYRGTLTFDAMNTDDVVFLIYHLVEYYTDTLLLHENTIIPFHGGMVSKNNKIYPILAPTHTGKSTLIAYLCGKGYDYMSDDYIFCGLDGSAFSFNLPLSLRTVKYLTENNKSNIVYSGYNKYKSEYVYLYSSTPKCNRCLEGSTIEKFIFINRCNENSIQKLNCGEAYVHLLNNLKTAVMIDRREKLLLEFARQLECFYICYDDMDFVQRNLDVL